LRRGGSLRKFRGWLCPLPSRPPPPDCHPRAGGDPCFLPKKGESDCCAKRTFISTNSFLRPSNWVPACAGMTMEKNGTFADCRIKTPKRCPGRPAPRPRSAGHRHVSAGARQRERMFSSRHRRGVRGGQPRPNPVRKGSADQPPQRGWSTA